MTALNYLLASLKVEANVFHNGQYCGTWAVDTSGLGRMNFHVVSYGQCYFRIAGRDIKLSSGDAIFFPTDAPHIASSSVDDDIPVNQSTSIAFTDAPQSDATGLVCGNFGHQNPVFEKLVEQLPQHIVVRAENSAASAAILRMMVDESRYSDQSTNLLLNRLADCLFYILVRDHINTDSGVFAAVAHPKLSKPMARIHKSIDEKLSLDVLAQEAAMSRSAFATLFKEVVEQSPMEYITQWRMTQAYRWLVDDRISTYEAALKTGYESEASFSKAFKRVMNMGPGEARKVAGLG